MEEKNPEDLDNLQSLNDDNILNANKKQISGLDLNGLAADEQVEEIEDNGDFDEIDSP